MANPILDRTLAFAGVCQCAKLIQDLAEKGHCDTDALQTSLKSILVTDPVTTKDACGEEYELILGLRTFIDGLDNSASGNSLMRYIIGILTLEKKLRVDEQADRQLTMRLASAKHEFELDQNVQSPNMLATFASMYLDIISPLGPRIQVQGEPAVLKQEINQQKVRAILLAGVRNAVLWRQVGGQRRHLILGRKRMVQQANILIARN